MLGYGITNQTGKVPDLMEFMFYLGETDKQLKKKKQKKASKLIC